MAGVLDRASIAARRADPARHATRAIDSSVGGGCGNSIRARRDVEHHESARHMGCGYFALVHTHRDDLAMKAEIDRLKIQNEELQGQSAEAQRLAAMLGFINAHTEVPMVAARVIAAGADSTSHTFYINRGEHEGIRRDMAVITADGVVGKVLYVYGMCPTCWRSLIAIAESERCWRIRAYKGQSAARASR